MAKKNCQHVNRQLTENGRERHAQIREAAMKDFPPKGARDANPRRLASQREFVRHANRKG